MSYKIFSFNKPYTYISQEEAELINKRAYTQNLPKGWQVFDKRKYWQEDLESVQQTGWPATVFFELQLSQYCNYTCKHCLHACVDSKFNKDNIIVDTYLAEERGKLANKILKAYVSNFNVKHLSVSLIGGELSLLPVQKVKDFIREALKDLNDVIFEVGLTTNLEASVDYFRELQAYVPNLFINASYHDSIIKNHNTFFTKVLQLEANSTGRPIRVHTTVDGSNQYIIRPLYWYLLRYNIIPTFTKLMQGRRDVSGLLSEGLYIFDNKLSLDSLDYSKNENGAKDTASALVASKKCYNDRALKSIWFNGASVTVGGTSCDGPKYGKGISEFNLDDFIKVMKNVSSCDKSQCNVCKQSIVYIE